LDGAAAGIDSAFIPTAPFAAMHIAQVEIYSDTTNLAVIRHPGRNFPGSLIQGDSLYHVCCMADEACARAREAGCEEAFAEVNKLRNLLWHRLIHYKQVLGEHGIALPFSETPRC